MILYSMAFDEGDCIFDFRRCLFEYKGREYMLYPGDSKVHMSIDTIVANEVEEDQAFESIHEFLYCFGWNNDHYFHFLGDGSSSPADKSTLQKRECPLCVYPRRFLNRGHLLTMVDPNASDDFKKAIALYNDAKYTNDIYYSFFCLYKIIDLPIQEETRNPVDWINSHIHLIATEGNKPLHDYIHEKSNFGHYIQDECRNALAHIHRINTEKKSILPFRASDYRQIAYAKYVIQGLVDIFIKDEIGIPNKIGINIINTKKK